MPNHSCFHFFIVHYLIPIFRPLYVVCRLCVVILPLFHLFTPGHRHLFNFATFAYLFVFFSKKKITLNGLFKSS
ncbi:hypothetical protein NC651_023263 [Populus alba x Populus x berolinensis]|nr:hypothetical protein NC651_023258 [Populus alba x Populus x berolinensis]KAJ6897338.1 hypothetical protein NC651_023263 [Populus alba x Populus x berolinensis]